jgi:hypothetical protein
MERDVIISNEVERTRREAEDMWARAQAEDKKRLQSIQRERERQEAEQLAREEILHREMEERERKDRARRESIRRQEELLSGVSGAGARAKLETEDQQIATGIQVYHYQDPGGPYMYSSS